MSKNNKKNNDLNIKTIWKMLRSEKGRRYSFIIFYIFFFGFLFIFINANHLNSTVETTSGEEYSLPFNTKLLEQNSYNFKYIVKSNLDELLYKGIKNSNSITIIDDAGEHLFSYKNGVLIGDYNILYKELFDIYEIKRIIKSGKLISETKLSETGEIIYNYDITNSNLDNILNNSITSLELINKITVKTNSKKEFIEINYDLINYEKDILCINTCCCNIGNQ